MANLKMVILRGNAAKAGSYPDEQGKTIAWPIGALHVKAASDFAKNLGYDPFVLDVPGKPQSQHSPQAKAALKAFNEDELVAAFYGFSGGGYNLRHILEYLAANEPRSLHRIHHVVVIGAPFPKQGGKMVFAPSRYNTLVSKKAKGDGWQEADWTVIYREDPEKGHMFGPDVLLTEWSESPPKPHPKPR